MPKNTSVKGATYPDAAFIYGEVAMAVRRQLPASRHRGRASRRSSTTRSPTSRGTCGPPPTSGATPWSRPRTPRTRTSPPSSSPSWWSRRTCGCSARSPLELPTRQSLVEEKLDFAVRPDLMPVYVDQSTTLDRGGRRAGDRAVLRGRSTPCCRTSSSSRFRGRQSAERRCRRSPTASTAGRRADGPRRPPGSVPRRAGPAARRGRRWSDLVTGYAFVTPNLLLLVLFLFVPLGWAFVLSFQDVGSFGPATWVGLDNYRQLGHRPRCSGARCSTPRSSPRPPSRHSVGHRPGHGGAAQPGAPGPRACSGR